MVSSMRDSAAYYRSFIEDGYEFLNPMSFQDGKTFTDALAGSSEEAAALTLNYRLEVSDDSGNRLRHATAPWVFAGSPLVVIEDIRDAISAAIGEDAQLLPMNVEIQSKSSCTMWYLHTDHVVDDLDVQKSELRTVLGNRVASIKKLVLTDEHAPYPTIFKLSECRDFYCYSADFVSKLRGLNVIAGTTFQPL